MTDPLSIPSVITHSAALLRGFNNGQAMLPAQFVRSASHEGIGGLAVVVLLAVHERNGVQHKMVVNVFLVQMRCYDHLKTVSP